MEHACFGIDSLVWVQNNAQRLTRCRNEANVQLGSSRLTVSTPTRTASQSLRNSCTFSKHPGDVNRAASSEVSSTDPLASSANLTVYEGSPVFAPVHEGPHLFVSFGLHEADTGWNARIFKRATTVSSNRRVWVVMSDDDLADAGPHQRFCAGRSAPKVIARLQRDVCGGAVRECPFSSAS